MHLQSGSTSGSTMVLTVLQSQLNAIINAHLPAHICHCIDLSYGHRTSPITAVHAVTVFLLFLSAVKYELLHSVKRNVHNINLAESFSKQLDHKRVENEFRCLKKLKAIFN